MKFRERIARFMYGRYGADNLYNALFGAELILLFAGTILSVLGKIEPFFALLSVVAYGTSLGLLIFAMYRFFSRNVEKRRRENLRWLSFKAKLRRKPKIKLPSDTADHVFRACPHCSSTLRLPRQSGKHEVKCPRCGGRFRVRVK